MSQPEPNEKRYSFNFNMNQHAAWAILCLACASVIWSMGSCTARTAEANPSTTIFSK